MSDGSFTLTRRSLLQVGGMASAGAWVALHPGLARAADALSSTGGAPDYLVRSTYTGLSSATLTDVTGGGSTALLLTEVADVGDPSLVGSNDAFRLELSSTAAPMAGGIRTLSHPDIGQFDVFISPVGMPGSTMNYEVVVDRVVPASASPAPTDAAPSSLPAPGDAGPSAQPATAATGGATTAGRSGTGTAAHTVAHESAVQRIDVRRHGRGVVVDVLLRAGLDIASVRVRLEHDGHRLVAAGAKPRHGQARVTLATHHRLAAGSYAAVVTADPAHGAPQIERFPVTLH
jgi:hypothetical protein